jgi:hypothetical protein
MEAAKAQNWAVEPQEKKKSSSGKVQLPFNFSYFINHFLCQVLFKSISWFGICRLKLSEISSGQQHSKTVFLLRRVILNPLTVFGYTWPTTNEIKQQLICVFIYNSDRPNKKEIARPVLDLLQQMPFICIWWSGRRNVRTGGYKKV